MDKPKVFIDGREGTTGLQLWERLSRRTDLELLRIGEARRKDPAERKNTSTRPTWCFSACPMPPPGRRWGSLRTGTPGSSMPPPPTVPPPAGSMASRSCTRTQSASSDRPRRVANPGCHATGFLASAAPLSALHILLRDCPLTCFSLTGYSGGGRKMIAQYEAPDKPAELFSPRLYGTGLRHKHLTEMQKVAGLEQPPGVLPRGGRLLQGHGYHHPTPQPLSAGPAHRPGDLPHPGGLLRRASPWFRCAGAGMPPPSPPTLWRAPTGWSWWCAATRSRPSSPPSSITWAKAPLARRCRT